MKPAFDSDLYKSNLQAIEKRYPDLHNHVGDAGSTLPFGVETVQTPAGQVNVIATTPDGSRVPMYTEADILSETRQTISGWQLEAEDFLFCVGIGLGYLPLCAARTLSHPSQIVIIEPNVEMLRLALQTVDLKDLIAYERLGMHVGPELKVADIIGRYGERIFFGKNRLVSHGPSRLLFGDAFKALEDEVVENIRVVRNIGYTAKHGGEKIFANTMENLSSLLDGPDLATLAGRFAGCPAVCVAAGPSLDKSLSALRTIGNRALIICGDSAVRSLVEAGIRPHIVVTSDMNPVNFEKMRTSLHCLDEAVLVFSIEANPDNVGTFPGRRKIAVTAHNSVLNDWLGPLWSMAWKLPAMTSVSHTALFTAVGLGAGPIVLVGMDFAYSAGKSHASGSVFRYPASRDDFIEAQGVRGMPVYSLPQLSTDRKQIENGMAESTVRFIDTSLDGALIRGAENRSLQEVVDTMLDDDVDVSTILEGIEWQPKVNSQTAADQFTAMQGQVERFLADCSRHQVKLMEDEKRSITVDLSRLRSELERFERRYGMIVSILKILRYGDIKQTAAQLDKLASGADGNSQTAFVIYAGIYASLHRAGVIFEKKLQRATSYFVGENALTSRSGHGDMTAGNRYELADHYVRHGCTAKAVQTLIDGLGGKRDDIDGWLKLVNLFVGKRIWSLAEMYAVQMCRYCPEDPRAQELARTIDTAIDKLLDNAIASMNAGNVDDARRGLFEYHGLRTPDERSLALQKRIDAADRDRERNMAGSEMLYQSEDQLIVLHNKAKDCIRSRALEEAVGIYEGLALIGGEAACRAHESIGDIRLSQENGAGAAWHYRKALAELPGNIELEKKLNRAIRTGLNASKPATKVPSMKQHEALARPVRCRSPQELYQLAQKMVQEERVADAIVTLKNLVAEYPDFAIAHNDLAVLHYNQGETDPSYLHYKEAVRIEPENTTFLKNLADFEYFVNDDTRTALKIYVELLKENPHDQEVLLVLGLICARQGQKGDATLFYQRILELDPTNADALQGLENLSVAPSADHPTAGDEVSSNMVPPDRNRDPERHRTTPSPVIRVEVGIEDQRHIVKIPEQETFRIKAIFDQNEYSILSKRRKQGAFTVFDVGANVGLFALYFHASRPDSQIYCFEPSPVARELLTANVSHLEGITICNYGLYNRETQADMHIHRYNTGQNSIRFTGRHYDNSESVEVKDAGTQFDRMGIDHLDVLKIDTEGCEVDILESMGHRLDRVDYVLLEYHCEEDRRHIDQLLSRFHLFGAQAAMPGIGTVKYMHPDLV